MKSESLFIIIVFMIFAISTDAQVTPKPKVKTLNKQKGLTKRETQINGIFTDKRDGKTYKTIKIGLQTWMAENLAYKAVSGFLVHDTNETKFGYLYNWKTANEVCPSGWHLPSNDEWIVLTTYLRGEDSTSLDSEDTIGSIMKSITDWNDFDGIIINGTNASGFNGFPAGVGDSLGTIYGVGGGGFWWSSTERGTSFAQNRFLSYEIPTMVEGFSYKVNYLSVRCLKNL